MAKIQNNSAFEFYVHIYIYMGQLGKISLVLIISTNQINQYERRK